MYIHLMSNFLSIHFHTKMPYVHGRYSLQLWKRIDHLLITSGIFQDKRKYSACDLKCRYCVFTLWDRLTNVQSLGDNTMPDRPLTHDPPQPGRPCRENLLPTRWLPGGGGCPLAWRGTQRCLTQDSQILDRNDMVVAQDSFVGFVRNPLCSQSNGPQQWLPNGPRSESMCTCNYHLIRPS